MRIRKKGDKLELTKKVPNNNDASNQTEHTIPLSEEEYNALLKVSGKKLRKLRYYFHVNNKTAEIDVFQDELAGKTYADIKDFLKKYNYKLTYSE